MHLDSNALSEEPGIWLFIYPQPSFEDSPPWYKSWQSTSRPQSCFSLWWSLWSTARSQLCLPYVSRVFRAMKIPRAWPSDICIIFFPENEQRGTCQSVFFKANSGREAAVCSCHWAKGINVAQTWGTVQSSAKINGRSWSKSFWLCTVAPVNQDVRCYQL